jgi:hypothetical protein
MKASEEDDFQHCDPKAISQFTITDCLDLYRKLQFLGLIKTKTQKNLVESLKLRIITLVLPEETGDPTVFHARSNRADNT